jgi:UDP-N-acetylmuramate dehydrogenase
MNYKIEKDNFLHIRGTFTENAPLGSESWFGCGGTADLLFSPANEEDLAAFLKDNPQEVTILGGMANTIIRDSGIRGVTVRLGRPFAEIKIINDTYIEAGAGALNGSVAAAAMKAGIGGLEFLSGIPGMVGGALRMNAGAYGTEIKDVLTGVNAVSKKNGIHRLVPEQLHMTYRHTDISDGTIFTSAIFKGKKETYDIVRARMNEIKEKRNATQPIREKTGGSTFANPSPQELKLANLPEGTRAWKIVELVGGRGLKIGGAQMSEMHCNFMINTGDATASDLEMLGEELRKRAHEKFGLNLRWEIQRVGDP